MTEYLKKDDDDESTATQPGDACTASNSEEEPLHHTVIFIQDVDVVVAGKGNMIQGKTAEKTRGCSLKINSREHLTCVMTPNSKMFPNALKRTGPCAGRAYTFIVTKSRQLTDAGLTNEFIRLTNKLAVHTEQKENKDLHVIVLLQKAIFNIYTKKNDVASKELKVAEQMTDSCLNRNLLLGRCYTYEAYIKVYENKFEEALHYIEYAKDLLANLVSGEEKAMVCYLTGYVYMKMAGEGNSPNKELEDKAIEYFQLHDRHVKEDTEREIAIKEMQYGIFKQVTVYLRTYTIKGYQYGTNVKNIEKAKTLLDFFETNLWHEATPASKIHFTMLRADYFYRKDCLERALYMLENCGVKLAKEVGHKPMIDMVNDRVRIIESLIARKGTQKEFEH